jgi:hypothetical protein
MLAMLRGMGNGNEQLLPGAAYPVVPFIPAELLSRLGSENS